MKLHWSPRSPFVRKVMIAAHELGLADRINTVRTVVAMTKPHHDLMLENPLSKIPTLVLDDGTILYDSLVIMEYFDTLHAGPKLFPAPGPERFAALRRHALGNGFLDLLVLARNERDRPDGARSQPHLDAFAVKVESTLDALEATEVGALTAAPFGVDHITIGVAMGYMDFRFTDNDWRKARPRLTAWAAAFSARPSFEATKVVDDL